LNSKDYVEFLSYIKEELVEAPKEVNDSLKIIFCSSNYKTIFDQDSFAVKRVQKLTDSEALKFFINKVPLSEDDKN